MNDRDSILQSEYGGEFEDLEFEDMDLEDMDFKTADEFEDAEAYGDSEFEGLEELFELSEPHEFELETRAQPGRCRRGRSRIIPHDHSICGVPRRQTNFEYEMEFEAPKKPAFSTTVRPRLCYYQNHWDTSHRNHFKCQAVRWARRVGAIASPNPRACKKKIGATPYNTGADLITGIVAAAKCTKGPVDLVHVFSHSGSYGVFGTTMGSAGLYYGKLDASSRNDGGRTIDDVPLTNLSPSVVFVLHGCNTAEGDNSFAEALYQHLSKSLKAPKVYGHYNSGCAGRDNSWREFSRTAPNGRKRTGIAPYYSGKGCCS